jgi:hypothetical protein
MLGKRRTLSTQPPQGPRRSPSELAQDLRAVIEQEVDRVLAERAGKLEPA